METVATNSVKAWILAARPKTLAAAVVPVLVGSALSMFLCNTPEFDWRKFAICFLFASLMQIAANLINDLFDFLKGSDGKDRLGPERAMAQGWITKKAMLIGIAIVVGLAAVCGLCMLPIIDDSQVWTMIGVGIFCIFFAYFYTSGPFPLSYNGLGDVAVVGFFGVVATCFTCYCQLPYCFEDIRCVVAGVATGLAINALLVVNNYRDRETDANDGKRTLIVKLGERFGELLYLGCGFGAVALMLYVFREHIVVLAFYIPYVILHLMSYTKLVRIKRGKALNQLIGESSRNMMVFAIMTVVAMVI
ncbi:MAG: 1,4-dihydroxy-2-naphthoate octaprenyltransferase [Paludibacteraceae bacterium]|nr:1,4-dihydroxy-2-naphthoate octaprenyltransferase [Paludibacteraceae bacterium]